MLGLSEDRRETGARGVIGGMSPRSDELDDLRPREEEERSRFRLATLELRRNVSGAKPGEEGCLCASTGFLGDLTPGDCGKGVFVAT